ncbi:serpin family protein [Brachybacterium sp. UMB0905]|uniref:serpin family protein n=1 Tax=Brachybacterium sp. UMB0905 TaxID=2069310 RepID=UPI000C801C57|nr:serpin family protein [Brachybacterium sp. UMB0905]PMC74885.1 serpin family protein [Brachybacterium sp. UMB0905]
MTVELSPVTTFTARLLPALARPGGNTVCSPLSAQVALTLAALGARGETFAELEQVLGAPARELARTAAELAQSLAAITDPAAAHLASGVWVHDEQALRGQYRERVEQELGAGIGALDLTDAAAIDRSRTAINAWVAERTGGRIPELLSPGMLTPQTLLVLISALHVTAPWMTPLHRADGDFALSDGTEVTVPMLHGTGSGWHEDAHATATALPTKGGALSLVLVRPAASTDAVLEAWAADPSALAGLLDSALGGGDRVRLGMPALETSWGADLSGPLRELGLRRALSPAADLRGILEGPAGISMVIQQAVLSIDEHGMEAAAATAAIMLTGAPATPRHELTLDRPYLLLVCDTARRTPLLVGRIEDPQA